MSLLDKILKNDLFKARHGIYADTAENRRLHRVGQEYGHAAKEEVPGSGRKPARQDDEQKNLLAAKLDSLSPTQLSKLVDTTEKRIQEFKDKGYEQGVQKLEEVAREARKRLMGDEAYEKHEKEKSTEEKKPEKGGALEEVQKRFDELKGRIKGLKKDGYDGEDVQAIEKQYRSLRRALRKMKKKQAIADTTTEQPAEKPVKEPKADEKLESTGDDVKVEARMTFDDIPNSGKVKMAKYLSGARKNKVDSDFKAIKGLDDATVQTLHDGLVKKFNEEFDSMSKADRAEALYKIAKVKNELQKNDGVNKKPSSEDKVGSVKVDSKNKVKTNGSGQKLPEVPKGDEGYFDKNKNRYIDVDRIKFEAWEKDIAKLEYFDGTKEDFQKLKDFNDKLADKFEEKHPKNDNPYVPDDRFNLRNKILSSDAEVENSGFSNVISGISRLDEYQIAVANKALIEKGYQPVVRADMYYKMKGEGSVNSFVTRSTEETLALKEKIKNSYKKLPQETKEAIKKYTGSGWRKARYDGDTSMNKPINDYVRSTPLEEDIMLIRGLRGGDPESNKFIEKIMNTPIGGTYRADGFSSFSAGRMSTSFANTPFKISMVGRKGQKIAPLYAKDYTSEMEFIPPTDSTFRVLQKGLGSVVVELVDE